VQRREKRQDCLDSIYLYGEIEHSIFVFENLLGGWVPAVRAMMKMLPPEAQCFIMGDDERIAEGCLPALHKAFNEKFPDGDGIVWPDDGFSHRDELACFPYATAGYFLKWMYSGYNHAFVDNELAIVARNRDKYMYVEEAKIVHPVRTPDETYELNAKTAESDKILYEDREGRSKSFTDLSLIEWDND